VKSRDAIAELDETSPVRLIRLTPVLTRTVGQSADGPAR
jgi:hypothetical protein